MSRPQTIEEAVELWGFRPEILDQVVPYYDSEWSVYPEKVRISFKDGTTIVYDTRTEQPHALIMENIRIIRKWRQILEERPRRRRRA